MPHILFQWQVHAFNLLDSLAASTAVNANTSDKSVADSLCQLDAIKNIDAEKECNEKKTSIRADL